MPFQRSLVLFIALLGFCTANASTYYGANSSDWKLIDANPSGATITAEFDTKLFAPVVKFSGTGTQNAFIAGAVDAFTGWNHQDGFWLNWRMRTSAGYIVFVRVDTTRGRRYFNYNHSNNSFLLHANGKQIHYGLGSSSKNGRWQTWSRNLAQDLSNAEPGNVLLAVNGVIVRGNVSIDSFLLSQDEEIPAIVHADAESGNTEGWTIFDNTPAGADIKNVVDASAPTNRAIELSGTRTLNSFKLGGTNASTGWNNNTQTDISWRSKSTSYFRIHVPVTTPLGTRTLWYDSRDIDSLANSTGKTIHHGLGSNTQDGNWHTHFRDLEADLQAAEPTNTIIAVQGFIVRGNLQIDDVAMLGESVSTDIPDMPTLNDYELVFNDEFDGTSLDPNKWNTGLLWGPYLPINNEQQLYVDTLGINADFSHSPFEFTGNSMIINATQTDANLQPPARPDENDTIWDDYSEYRFNGPDADGPGYQASDVDYLSGIITSYESFKMTHGYVEARIKLPAGQGLWPAFWLLNSHYIEDSPEIDVVEFLGQNTDKVYHSYHYFEPQNDWAKISTPTFETTAGNWTEDFHHFGMLWSPTEIIWYVDGVETQRITDSEYVISKQAMYIIANLAVGGNWPGPTDTTTPANPKLEIDYIRAYKKKQNPTLDLAADYQLMFSDEFDTGTLDPTKWNTSFLWGPYLTINNEEQYYVDINNTDSDSSYSPFSFNNGVMTITADVSSNSASDIPPPTLPGPNDPIWTDNPAFQQGPYAGPPAYTSGLITSYDAFKFVNGYAEIRAKVPAGDGLWPAFWLLHAYYVGPQPEIDIMEILGESPQTSYHTFHRSDTNGAPLKDEYISTNSTTTNGYADDFHTYGVRWNPGEITWYVDGVVVDTYTEPGYNENDAYQLMYVLANLAVGGNFNSQPVDESALPAHYEIDYIRVYQEK